MTNFNQKELGAIWHDSDIFLFALEQTNVTKNRDYLAKILAWAADLMFYRMDGKYLSKSPATHTRRNSLDKNLKQDPAPADFGN